MTEIFKTTQVTRACDRDAGARTGAREWRSPATVFHRPGMRYPQPRCGDIGRPIRRVIRVPEPEPQVPDLPSREPDPVREPVREPVPA